MTAQDIKRIVMERNLSMIGYVGLSNVEHTLKNIKENNLEGDFVETGCWRGGACLYARALMNELGLKGTVYACDSFQGVPPPDPKYPLDEGDGHHLELDLVASLEAVKGYFKEYNLEEGTEFIKGWFKYTMPVLQDHIEKIAILRLDGDLYQSTMEALDALYDKVIVGGIVIVDDYGLDRCKWAIDDFFKKRGLTEELKRVEHAMIAVWQKERL